MELLPPIQDALPQPNYPSSIHSNSNQVHLQLTVCENKMLQNNYTVGSWSYGKN